MDWNAAVERNREALKRVLAILVAMAGLDEPFAHCLRERVAASRPAGSGPAPTLPRHLHRAVVRLLHPAEAAARRLIIVAARGLVVALPPARPRRPKPATAAPHLRRFGLAVVMPPADLAAVAAAGRAAVLRAERPRIPSLPLLDPLPRFPSKRRRPVPGYAAPRILFPGLAEPFRLPPRPSRDDPVGATRLAARLAALAAALDDLPGQAKRFARWKAHRDAAGAQKGKCDAAGAQKINRDAAVAQAKQGRDDAGARGKHGGPRRFRRIWPLRPGRPLGWRRRHRHEVHDVLDVLHGLAFWVLEPSDTS